MDRLYNIAFTQLPQFPKDRKDRAVEFIVLENKPYFFRQEAFCIAALINCLKSKNLHPDSGYLSGRLILQF
jgi:hypothetical protein